MGLEEDARQAMRTVNEHEGKIKKHEQRLDNQYTATEALIERVSRLEKELLALKDELGKR